MKRHLSLQIAIRALMYLLLSSLALSITLSSGLTYAVYRFGIATQWGVLLNWFIFSLFPFFGLSLWFLVSLTWKIISITDPDRPSPSIIRNSPRFRAIYNHGQRQQDMKY